LTTTRATGRVALAVARASGSGRPACPRRIGRAGTAARVPNGLSAIVLPVALSDVTWWDVGAALVVLPLTAVLAASALAVADRRCWRLGVVYARRTRGFEAPSRSRSPSGWRSP
jgi:hypothetical protein